MIAIKFFPATRQYAVCTGVMEEYAKWNPDGTFSGTAGISMHQETRRLSTLEEAREAKKAFEAFAEKYQ